MPFNIQLHYFHGRGIGEPIRLLLTVGGVDFVDHRYGIDEFAAMTTLKEQLPFGQLPALEVNGNFMGQTDSLMRFCAKVANLYPGDPLEAARSDMIVVYQAEIHSAIAKMSFDGVPGAPGTKLLPEAERQERIRCWIETTLPGLLERLERLAGDGFMVGNKLSWADVCVFNRLTQLQDIDESVLNGRLSRLQTVHDKVAALPSIRNWIANHLEDYPRSKAAVVS